MTAISPKKCKEVVMDIGPVLGKASLMAEGVRKYRFNDVRAVRQMQDWSGLLAGLNCRPQWPEWQLGF